MLSVSRETMTTVKYVLGHERSVSKAWLYCSSVRLGVDVRIERTERWEREWSDLANGRIYSGEGGALVSWVRTATTRTYMQIVTKLCLDLYGNQTWREQEVEF